jgi:hypothetical protein
VKFHPGLDRRAGRRRAGAVVGTNDLHNPRVTAGDHSPHPLIRRSYVDELGASWDGPKNAAHEGYRHWFVDDEIVTAAKQRGVWVMAHHAKVEHMHPLWGLAEDDATYALGREHVAADRELFKARLAGASQRGEFATALSARTWEHMRVVETGAYDYNGSVRDAILDGPLVHGHRLPKPGPGGGPGAPGGEAPGSAR